FQLAVADTLTGLEVVFVTVPRADEMRFVAVGLALVEAVLVDYIDDVLRDHAFAGRSALVQAGVAVGVECAALVKDADLALARGDDLAVAFLDVGRFSHQPLGHFSSLPSQGCAKSTGPCRLGQRAGWKP